MNIENNPLEQVGDPMHSSGSIRFKIIFARLFICSIVWVLIVSWPQSEAWSSEQPRDDYEWALTTYYGILTDDTISDIATLSADYDSSYQFLALALSKNIGEIGSALEIEAEGQIVKHTKGQDHWEVNGLVAARWTRFPWDRRVDTSVALGLGISYATSVPPFELERKDGDTRKLLGYIMFEVAVGLPAVAQWDLVSRVHHRSGAWGVFGDGVRGASNSITLGVKYRF